MKAAVVNGEHKKLNSEKTKMKADEMSQEPTPMEQYNWLIYLQHVRGETGACMELIKRELERSNGRNEFALGHQGIILREEGKVQEALETFQKCLKLNPDNSTNLKEAGKCLYDMCRFTLSMDAYLEAERISKDPDWEIYYYLGHCSMKLGDTAKAKEYAHKAVKLGKFECCYELLIKILVAEGDLKSAASVSNAAVESWPDSVTMLTESGLLFLKMGQSQQAFERLSSALALEPMHPKALLGVGYITQKHEEYDVALSKYKTAVHDNPDSVALWNNIGMCFYSKKKYVAAISCLKRALWISPLNWRTLYNLGLTHLATSQPASAFNFICAAVNLRSDVADCFAVLGSALIELKDPENALRAFHQALRLSPDDPVYLANTALCSLQADRFEEACDLLSRLKSLLENGAFCTEEVTGLIEKLSVAMEEQKHASVPETTEDETHRGSVDDENVEGNDSPYSEFPSGAVTEKDDEV